MSIQNFIQAEDKVGFEEALGKGKVTENQIAFIESDDLIWARGKYYGAIPDNEDLTKNKSGELQLSDRSYSPSDFSGMGYKILRKNMVAGKNVLTQEMITDPNTIYEIRYDYDLEGAEITIPEGCTLKFVGGSLKNGVIKGNNTIIVNKDNDHIFTEIYFHTNDVTSDYSNAGLFICKEIYAKWFGIIPNNSINYQDKFEQLSSLICCCENINLYFDEGNYKFGKQDSIDQRGFKTISHLILFIGHCLLKFTGNNIKNIKIYGNGAVFEDICRHKVGWFNSNGTPDFSGQDGYSKKQFAFCGSGIVFRYMDNLENIYIENLSINLNFQNYEYGGRISPTMTSHGIDFTNVPKAKAKIFNCKSINCITDGFYGGKSNTVEIDSSIAHNCMRTGFVGEGTENIICTNNQFYCDYDVFIPHDEHNNVYILEAPNSCMNLEYTLKDIELSDVYINNCKFGDCLNKTYQLNIIGKIRNTFINNCIFERRKAIDNGGLNIVPDGNIHMDNIIFINSRFSIPSVQSNKTSVGSAYIGKVTVFPREWDTILEDYKDELFILCGYSNNKGFSKVSELNIYIKDKFSIGISNDPRNQFIDNMYIYVNEELKTGSYLGQLPNINNLYITDYNTVHTIDNDKIPYLRGLDLVKNIYYTKVDNTDNIFTIRFPNAVYKQNINWVNSRRYAPINVNKIEFYDGNYDNPSTIQFSCLTNKLTFNELPKGSLSYRANIDDNNCRFWKWNGEKFDEYFSLPRKTKHIDFNSLEEFKTFCSAENIIQLYKGERVYINKTTYIGTGDKLELVDAIGNPIDALKQGTSSQRPVGVKAGFYYFDTDINKPIWKKEDTGTAWVDSTGIEV